MFLLIFFITLLILVISHEMGHFLVAKKFGVKVLEFGFGIPPRAWGKKIGETIYSLNWLPLGGFVRLLGEDEVDKKLREDKRSFSFKPVWQRVLIVVAGVGMNLLLAWIVFYAVLLMQDFRILYPTLKPGIFVTDIEKGSPAEAAGFNAGDEVIKIDDKTIGGIEETISYIKSKPATPLSVVVSKLDSQEQKQLTVTPKEVSPGMGRVGIAFSPIPVKKYTTFAEKVFSAPLYSFDLVKVTFRGLADVLQKVGQQNFEKASEGVSGPVGLAVATRNVVSTGDIPLFLWFMGLLSLSLAVINILPFPALDGGRVFFLLIEGVVGKKVKPEVERFIHTAGMVVLLGLIFLITYSDIKKFF